MPRIPSPRAVLRRWRDSTPADVPIPENYNGPACATANCHTRAQPWNHGYFTANTPDGVPTLRCLACVGELEALHGFTDPAPTGARS